MSANTNAALATAEPLSLADLSDGELLVQTRSLVGRSNRLLAELLAHLGEVEARGVHRIRACSSLYTYCIYELRFSEDEAFRRVAASRLVRRFPALLDAIAAGELHLTGLLMLGPHLTAENLAEVMARAKHRTKREIARLVRVLDPLPPVRARIEPLGPAPARLVPPEPTWQQFVGAMNPVRELAAGERPREWGLGDEGNGDAQTGHEDAEPTSSHASQPATDAVAMDPRGFADFEMCAPARVEAMAASTDAADFVKLGIAAPARVHAAPCSELAAAQLYKVQFTATEEYVRLVDEAQALLSHAAPRASLEEIQLRAMRAFVQALRKRKYGTPARVSETSRHAPASRTIETGRAPADQGDESSNSANERAPSAEDSGSRARPQPSTDEAPNHARQKSGSDPMAAPRQRGRHIPAAIRHAVITRDGCRCTYTDAWGTRCAETQRLEFHHIVPFAVSHSHEVTNLTLRCAAHNALAAEEDFGRELVQQRRNAARYDRFCEYSR